MRFLSAPESQLRNSSSIEQLINRRVLCLARNIRGTFARIDFLGKQKFRLLGTRYKVDDSSSNLAAQRSGHKLSVFKELCIGLLGKRVSRIA